MNNTLSQDKEKEKLTTSLFPPPHNKDDKKDVVFYAEIIIVTAVALLAANLLTEGFKVFIHRRFPKSTLIWIFSSAAVGGLSILILWKIFGSKHDSPYVRNPTGPTY